MRVIGGIKGSLRIKSSKSRNLRPTMDRVRETVFNILGNSVSDAFFLDLFAGTGSVGIEALSRGARKVIFVEKEFRTRKIPFLYILIDEHTSDAGLQTRIEAFIDTLK